MHFYFYSFSDETVPVSGFCGHVYIMWLTCFIHLPMKMEPIRSSETSAIKTQTPGNYPKRIILQLKYGEAWKQDWYSILATTVVQEWGNRVGHVQVWYSNRKAFCVKSEAIVVVGFRSFWFKWTPGDGCNVTVPLELAIIHNNKNKRIKLATNLLQPREHEEQRPTDGELPPLLATLS